MKFARKITGFVLLGCFLLGSELFSETYDHSKLENMPVEEARRVFYGLRLNYMAVPKAEKRPDLLREAQYWLSKKSKAKVPLRDFFS